MKPARWALLVGLAASALWSEAASAALCARPYPQYVCPGDWVGSWSCTIDGKTPTTLVMREVPNCSCSGGICSCAGYLIEGTINGTRVFTQRKLDSGDPATTRTDHLLPTRAPDGGRGLYMMHTWNRRLVSGYGYWGGAPYPHHCTRM